MPAVADVRFSWGYIYILTVDALAYTLENYPEITDVQIFTHGPQSWRATKAFDDFAPIARAASVRIWTHGSYLCVPWKEPKFVSHTLDNIRASHRLGSGCVVAHIPFAPVNEVVGGIRTLVARMREHKLTDVKLMLEVSATVRDDTRSYESPEKLNRLTRELFAAGFDDCVRICVDTAHIFAGRAQISSADDARKWWAPLDTRLLGMIHLNGSSYDPNVRKGDKHEVPMSSEDLIWGISHVSDVSGGSEHSYSSRGCSVFVEHARRLKIPMILEINPRHSVAAIKHFIHLTSRMHQI
jgi:endonuclease IV